MCNGYKNSNLLPLIDFPAKLSESISDMVPSKITLLLFRRFSFRQGFNEMPLTMTKVCTQ